MAVLFLEDSGEDYGLLLTFFCDQSNGKNMFAEYRDAFVAFLYILFVLENGLLLLTSNNWTLSLRVDFFEIALRMLTLKAKR